MKIHDILEFFFKYGEYGKCRVCHDFPFFKSRLLQKAIIQKSPHLFVMNDVLAITQIKMLPIR